MSNCNGTHLSNCLPVSYLSDAMPLDHWFHAFQTTFGDMLIAAPDPIPECLQDRSGITYSYNAALTLYAECFVRALPSPDADNHEIQGGSRQ